ncbi:hypothetical protein ABNQ39_06795 [Azospirillum sp. A26]|uniref:hypothetical protein n=1 Tax=Azospirillum sp. A26 TaxID=3160607 RepID=UPI0036728552
MTTNTALSAAIADFQRAYAELHRRYVGYRYDAAYRREIERLHAELGRAVQAAPPLTSLQDAASLIGLECMLFAEYEGESPVGIHATRLTALKSVRAFLERQAGGAPA